MALQQAQTLLSMNSLEAVNVGVQQNNTESFAVVLCHLAELHAEQVSFRATCTNLLRGLWVLLTEGARLDLWFFLPSKLALGAETMQGVRLANPFPEGCAGREGSRACPGALISVLLFQGYFAAASEILKHLKERFPPNSQHAQVEYLAFSL